MSIKFKSRYIEQSLGHVRRNASNIFCSCSNVSLKNTLNFGQALFALNAEDKKNQRNILETKEEQ